MYNKLYIAYRFCWQYSRYAVSLKRVKLDKLTNIKLLNQLNVLEHKNRDNSDFF